MPIALTQKDTLRALMRDAFIKDSALKGYLSAYIGPSNTNPATIDGILFETGGLNYSHPQFDRLFPRERNYRLYARITLEGDVVVVQPLHLVTNRDIGSAVRFPL
ncbi:hypothetical protein KBA73_05810 [Patescibacteria group bacterium]|nr:hypothetical protein [Patescibacteria group bacterium]